jgi:hypothetical protein
MAVFGIQDTSCFDCGPTLRYSLFTMAQLETIDIPHLPSSLPVYVALYRNVENADFLKQQLLAGKSEFEYALIDASMVCAQPLLNSIDDKY